MIPIATLEELRKIELDILISIDEFCRGQGIRYALAYGTLIGVIRHKGFIPWDDDIDIWMPRPDYNFFIRNFQHPYYKVLSMETEEKWTLYFAKITDTRTIITNTVNPGMGIFVDIFPIDGAPSNLKRAISFKKGLIKLRSLSELIRMSGVSPKETHTKYIRECFIHLCYKLNIHKLLLIMLCNRIAKYDYDSAIYVIESLSKKDSVIEKDVFEEYTKGEFEGYQFAIPKEYDFLLRRFYGDYMQLPPEEKRTLAHSYKAFWKA